jgi:CRP-like cAMP-binding protein
MIRTAFTRQEWQRTGSTDSAQALAQVPIFKTLRKRQLGKLARHAELGEFVPGDVVTEAGGCGDFFYVILGGEAEVRSETRTRRLRGGDHFGETALLEGTKPSVAVVATDDLQVLRLPGRVFLQLVRKSPVVAVAILRELGARARRDEAPPIPHAA